MKLFLTFLRIGPVSRLGMRVEIHQICENNVCFEKNHPWMAKIENDRTPQPVQFNYRTLQKFAKVFLRD